MLSAVLLSLLLSLPAPPALHSGFAGVWVLNLQKSDWGSVPNPEQVVLRIEQSDRSLSVWEVVMSHSGRHVSYRQIQIAGDRCSNQPGLSRIRRTCVILANTGAAEEQWEISEAGELILNRQARLGVERFHQHLVLEPSAEALE